MPATYEPIATTTFAGSTNTLTFSSISASYTDLRIVFNSAVAAGDNALYIRFNDDTAGNYGYASITGNGTSVVTSAADPNETLINAGVVNGSSKPSFQIIDIFSYAGGTNKTILCQSSEDATGSGSARVVVGAWRQTTAINSIRLFTSGSANFINGSTATLYGILRA